MVARGVGTPRSAGRISSLLKSEVRKYARISGCSDPSAQEAVRWVGSVAGGAAGASVAAGAARAVTAEHRVSGARARRSNGDDEPAAAAPGRRGGRREHLGLALGSRSWWVRAGCATGSESESEPRGRRLRDIDPDKRTPALPRWRCTMRAKLVQGTNSMDENPYSLGPPSKHGAARASEYRCRRYHSGWRHWAATRSPRMGLKAAEPCALRPRQS